MTDERSWPADCGPSRRWPMYTRGNVGEIYPNVVLPLEWELGGPGAELGWRQAAEKIGFLSQRDFGHEPWVMIGVFGGYAYFNASLMRLLGVRTPGLAVDVIDQQFLGKSDVAPYKPRPGDRDLAASARVVATALRTLRAKSVPTIEELKRRVDDHRRTAPSLDAPDDELWAFVRNIDELWAFAIATHVTVTLQATIAAGRLTDLCESLLGDPNAAVSLTTGLGDVVSARPVRAMWRLANETPDDAFETAFAQFLAEHGHRGPNEFSLVGQDWASSPDIARAAIDQMRGVAPQRSPIVQETRMAEARHDAMAKATPSLGRKAKRLEAAVQNTALWSKAREQSKNEVIRVNQPNRHAMLELMARAAKRGGVQDRFGPMLLSAKEFEHYLDDPSSAVATIDHRRQSWEHLRGLEPPFAFDSSVHGGWAPPLATWSTRATTADEAGVGETLVGNAGSPGQARGRVRIITDPGDPEAIRPGEILVAPITDAAWTPLFVAAAGVIVEVGAAMSHSMIVSRELGIPCVVGVAEATLRLREGTEVEIDGQAGSVRVLAKPD